MCILFVLACVAFPCPTRPPMASINLVSANPDVWPKISPPSLLFSTISSKHQCNSLRWLRFRCLFFWFSIPACSFVFRLLST
ncbi:hypothetical protein B9Z19DRAFT_1090182, partial [Tuber borchii]